MLNFGGPIGVAIFANLASSRRSLSSCSLFDAADLAAAVDSARSGFEADFFRTKVAAAATILAGELTTLSSHPFEQRS